MDNELYKKTVTRLSRVGIKDPTAVIIAMAEEIEHYRERITGLEALLYGYPDDPHAPLIRAPWETENEFICRLNKKINDGKLTVNAARKSLGLPPIEHSNGEG